MIVYYLNWVGDASSSKVCHVWTLFSFHWISCCSVSYILCFFFCWKDWNLKLEMVITMKFGCCSCVYQSSSLAWNKWVSHETKIRFQFNGGVPKISAFCFSDDFLVEMCSLFIEIISTNRLNCQEEYLRIPQFIYF